MWPVRLGFLCKVAELLLILYDWNSATHLPSSSFSFIGMYFVFFCARVNTLKSAVKVKMFHTRFVSCRIRWSLFPTFTRMAQIVALYPVCVCLNGRKLLQVSCVKTSWQRDVLRSHQSKHTHTGEEVSADPQGSEVTAVALLGRQSGCWVDRDTYRAAAEHVRMH